MYAFTVKLDNSMSGFSFVVVSIFEMEGGAYANYAVPCPLDRKTDSSEDKCSTSV